MAARTSATPLMTADSVAKGASTVSASSRARVVLPEPGGPQRTIEDEPAVLDHAAQRAALADEGGWPTNSPGRAAGCGPPAERARRGRPAATTGRSWSRDRDVGRARVESRPAGCRTGIAGHRRDALGVPSRQPPGPDRPPSAETRRPDREPRADPPACPWPDAPARHRPRGRLAADDQPPRPRVPRPARPRDDRLQRALRTEHDVLHPDRLGHRRPGGGRRQPPVAGRPGPGRQHRRRSAIASPRSPRRYGADVSRMRRRVGRRCRPGRRAAHARGDGRGRASAGRHPADAQRDLDRRDQPARGLGRGGAIGACPRSLILVDGISGVGAVPFETDGWGLDVVVTGSQKAWMVPPGLAMVAVSPRAWAAAERAHDAALLLRPAARTARAAARARRRGRPRSASASASTSPWPRSRRRAGMRSSPGIAPAAPPRAPASPPSASSCSPIRPTPRTPSPPPGCRRASTGPCSTAPSRRAASSSPAARAS